MTTRSDPIRVLIIDGHELFRQGVSALLLRDPRFEVVGDTAGAVEAKAMAHELQPDLVLLDNHLRHIDSLVLLSSLREAAPGARVLMLTVKDEDRDMERALRAGACGHLRKTVDAQALAEALVKAAGGDCMAVGGSA